MWLWVISNVRIFLIPCIGQYFVLLFCLLCDFISCVLPMGCKLHAGGVPVCLVLVSLVPHMVIPVVCVQRNALTGWLWLIEWMSVKGRIWGYLFPIHSPFLYLILHTPSWSVKERNIHSHYLPPSPAHTEGSVLDTLAANCLSGKLFSFHYTRCMFMLQLYFYLVSCDLTRDSKHHDDQSPGWCCYFFPQKRQKL